jgi:penicillin-binding protein 1A
MASHGSDELDDLDLEDRDPRQQSKSTKAKVKKVAAKMTAAESDRRSRARKYQTGRALRIVRNVVMGALGLGILGGLALTGLLFWCGNDAKLPKIEKIADYHPRQITRVVDREGRPLGDIGTEQRTLVPISKIPKVFLDAVVAAEDGTFYQNQGVDFWGILRAGRDTLMKGRFAGGGSTITQQVVKQLLLTPEKSLRRKFQEWILARQLTTKLTKQEILEIYVNENNYGHARYGCEEAARYYFGKSISDVNLGEAALLAGLPQIPTNLSPRTHPEAAKRRQMYVLGQMVKLGYVKQAEADKVAAQPIQLVPPAQARDSVAPEAVASVYRRLKESYGDRLPTLGVTVKSTIDVKLQELARESLERGLENIDDRQGYRGPNGHLSGNALEKHRAALKAAHHNGIKDSETVEAIVERFDKGGAKGRMILDLGGSTGVVDLAAETRYGRGAKPLTERFKPGDLVRVRFAPDRRHGEKEVPVSLELGPQAAMVVMDPQTRDVLALVGGYDFHPGGYDRSQRALRQPGSAFKPFLYAAAIESGRYTAASIVNDAPEVYDLWKPQNHEKEQFRGPVRLRTALALSINTVAIKVMDDLKLPLVRDFAHRMGITAELPDSLGLSAALGTCVVTPLELANAYSTFVAAGQRGEPRMLLSVGDEAVPPTPTQPALRPETAYVLVSLMRSVVDEGTARAAAGRIRRPIAGKTGTSNDLNYGTKDAWFVGFTPDLLAAVWVGFDDGGRSLGRGEAGARSALPIWIEFMAKALANRPARDFVQPPGVKIMQIDATTGLLAPPGAEGIAEVFIAGTEPKDVAPSQGEEVSPDKILLEGQQ